MASSLYFFLKTIVGKDKEIMGQNFYVLQKMALIIYEAFKICEVKMLQNNL